MRVARVARIVTATAASVLLAAACRKSLPTAPSELLEGLVVYQDANYRGKSAYVTTDMPDLDKFDGPCVRSDGDTTTSTWDNCISSVRLAPGWRAVLYGDDDYRGGRLEVSADVPDLKAVSGSCGQGFNDCISSIRVFRP